LIKLCTLRKDASSLILLWILRNSSLTFTSIFFRSFQGFCFLIFAYFLICLSICSLLSIPFAHFYPTLLHFYFIGSKNSSIHSFYYLTALLSSLFFESFDDLKPCFFPSAYPSTDTNCFNFTATLTKKILSPYSQAEVP
jgi:hypothetical protein